MQITDLISLTKYNEQSILFQCISGSRAYGTAHSNSDQDIRGIFVLPSSKYLSLKNPIDTIADKRNDIVYYSLHRFLQLASTANPNIIELLFMPKDCVQTITPFMQKIIEQRQLFITTKVYDTHIGYAQAQLKKVRGQNKWVNRPQPNEPPKKTDFCWVILQNDTNSAYPFRPILLNKANINASHCHVSSLEHAPNIYRLYKIGKWAHGIFKNDNIVCQSISKDEELNSLIGLLIFNKQGYESSLRDYQNYWQWRKNRNENRWTKKEKGYLDYDAKNIMHMFRLLLSGKNLLKHGSPIVKFHGVELELLKNILSGQYEYDELMNMAEKEMDELSVLKSRSSLPTNINESEINRLLRDVTYSWEKWIEK